ncbi:MAG: PilT/PilU family type 4a pilus ATPase [Planctomycetes bacterium]|nr:PilT/PilU family type 4a pilus ATPase [Planctomycetota bacterium]
MAWIDSLFKRMVEVGASDLHMTSTLQPMFRLHGDMVPVEGCPQISAKQMSQILMEITPPRNKEEFDLCCDTDFAYEIPGLARFRVNLFADSRGPGAVFRVIPEEILTAEQLNLPKAVTDFCYLSKGLVLVTGPTGSGKSTTLAGMIQHINRNAERHVVTLEDPVELIFKEDRCVISQREVGTDTESFNEGLKHALRQSPDVILIGEARDAETVIAALEATETGHMVLCTMHTVNAAQTIERLLGFFPAERHVQIRQRMADTLGGVLSQRLIQDTSGSLRPAYELMVPTPHVKELISEGKTTELARVIESGTERGLISFNQCLLDLVQKGTVELDNALETSDRPDELLLALRGISAGNDRGKEAQPRAATPPTPPAAGGPTLSKPKRPNDDFPKGLR